MRKLIFLCLLSVGVIIVGCEDRVVSPDATSTGEPATNAVDGFSKTGAPLQATITFGKDVGSPFPPSFDPHDRSDHARDGMAPRTVVIAEGGTVTFNIGPFHRVAIYEPGTKPGDIDVTATVNLTTPFFIPGFVIDDPDGRVAVAWANASELMEAPVSWDYTFNEPGKYFIICTTLPHFAGAQMYGWVDVKAAD